MRPVSAECLLSIDSLSWRTGPHHWASEDLLLLLSQKQAAWNPLFFRRHIAGLHQVALFWCDTGDIRFPQPLWVSILYVVPLTGACIVHVVKRLCHHSDFFPVILTFLRQLPFIGQVLNMPYIRNVSCACTIYIPYPPLCSGLIFAGRRSSCRFKNVYRMIPLCNEDTTYLYSMSFHKS